MIRDMRKHLGYDPAAARERIHRAARAAEHQAAIMRSSGRNAARRAAGIAPLDPTVPTVRVHRYELPKFVRDRADAKGISLDL